MSEPQVATVLVVDDQPQVLALVRSIIGSMPGWTLHEARSVAEALERAVRLRPDVILQDESLPDGSGMGLIAVYATTPGLEATQVIMLSATDDPRLKAQAFDLGSFDCMVKMPAPEEFRVRVRHAIRQAAVQRTLLAHMAEVAAGRERSERQVQALQRAEREIEDRSRELARANDLLRRNLQAREQEFNERIALVDRIGNDLNSLQDLDTLLKRLLADARSAFACEAGSILLRDGDSLAFSYAQNDVLNVETRFPDTKRSPVRLPIDRGSIAGAGAVDGMVVVRDAYDLPAEAPYRFNRSFDESTGFRTRAVLAVAMRDAQGRLVGVLQLINPRAVGGHHHHEFTEEDQHLARHFAGLAAFALGRAQMGESMILRMMRLAEMRDPKETGAHVKRVAEVASFLYEKWALARGVAEREIERQLDRLRPAAKLHDIGKVSIPDAVLKKPDKLDPAERAVMETHTLEGASSIDSLSTDLDESIAQVTLYHHAKWDGAGYPTRAQLETALGRLGRSPAEVPEPRGESIPIFARCVAVADVFDALMSRRAYKEAWSPQQARQAMLESSGSHFDPQLVAILDAHFDEIVKAHQLFAD